MDRFGRVFFRAGLGVVGKGGVWPMKDETRRTGVRVVVEVFEVGEERSGEGERKGDLGGERLKSERSNGIKSGTSSIGRGEEWRARTAGLRRSSGCNQVWFCRAKEEIRASGSTANIFRISCRPSEWEKRKKKKRKE